MAADQLLPAVLGHGGQVTSAALLHQQGEEVHLEEHVAQLVEQLGVVAALRRVCQLVGLLDGVRDDRALVLLAIPRTLAAQPPGELVEPVEGFEDVRPRHREKTTAATEPAGRRPAAAPAAAPAAPRPAAAPAAPRPAAAGPPPGPRMRVGGQAFQHLERVGHTVSPVAEDPRGRHPDVFVLRPEDAGQEVRIDDVVLLVDP